MADFYIKQGDTSPDFQVTFLKPDGDVQPYTGATSVRFHMLDKRGNTVIDADMVQTTPASGVATYEWQAADTDVAGFFNVECEVTFLSGKIQTYPNYGYFTVQITEELL